VEWGKWVLDYLTFTRRDRIGVIILVFLILFVFFLPRFFAGPGRTGKPADTAWVAKLRELELKQQKEAKVRERLPNHNYHPEFQVDRASYTPPANRPRPQPDTVFKNFRSYKKAFHYPVIDINIADTTAFIALPGIGSKLAARIINFREKLGGFYSVDQIGEVYGLADSVFQKLRQYLQLNDGVVKKININTATIDELKTHPYIKYNIANAIIAYRNAHGPFMKTEDIKKIMIIEEVQYIRIAPYLSLE
jgi:competence ComEA-like helix-hairpin-helix protein